MISYITFIEKYSKDKSADQINSSRVRLKNEPVFCENVAKYITEISFGMIVFFNQQSYSFQSANLLLFTSIFNAFD